MAFWYYVGIAVAAVLVLLALSSIRIRIRYSRSGELDQLIVIVRALYGLYRYRLIVPSIMIRGLNIAYEKKSSERIAGQPKLKMPRWRLGKGLLKHWKELSPWLKDTLKKVNCTRFRLDFRVGTGDAASTAVVSGLLWSVLGCAVGAAGHLVQLKAEPHGAVEPVYHAKEFTVVWEADFQVRAGSFFMSILHLGFGSPRLRKSWRDWRNWLRGPQSA
ncbi:DUF2953 domain-containing protein [Cohnella candidum]|uniref:DUF2953 domain-containing protein n=1 Tax=Cohnella candidum TaxID=2674991 RepID=A0A3G3JY43_9BACL|nr:DUF2953 domain-containing protein [Cohnella candidum]AYQ72767.1 DUF2953 domain-containing protein [Cohnella candidum]